MPSENKRMSFRLNMQMIVDGFQNRYPKQLFYRGEDRPVLEGACFLPEEKNLSENMVYLVYNGANLTERREMRGSFIVIGEIPSCLQEGENSILQLPAGADVFQVMNQCQEIFQRNREWSENLQEILLNDGSVADLCWISYPYFENPIFVHDSQLNLIACPVWKEGMIEWRKDPETGLMIAPYDVVNEFKADQEYLGTLKTHHADIFSADLRGHRDIYVNLWNDYGGYDGRLVICEMESALKPGQFPAAEYLAEIIRRTLKKRNPKDYTYSYVLDKLFLNLIKGNKEGTEDLSGRIAAYGWHMDDEYVCMRVNIGTREFGITSAGNACSYIEGQLVGCKAFWDEDRICVIVNISMNRNYTSDIAYILREGLYKAGFSDVFHNLADLKEYYEQASIALRYCLLKNDTNWYRSFGSIALDYFADHCSPDLSDRFFCDAALIKLEEYDQNNHTELYKTLKTYLLNERNTVKTSEELYVGRSTLFYRLRKIKKITGLDTLQFSDPERNLYLRLSFFILERKKN